jgi:hypothetical protein
VACIEGTATTCATPITLLSNNTVIVYFLTIVAGICAAPINNFQRFTNHSFLASTTSSALVTVIIIAVKRLAAPIALSHLYLGTAPNTVGVLILVLHRCIQLKEGVAFMASPGMHGYIVHLGSLYMLGIDRSTIILRNFVSFLLFSGFPIFHCQGLYLFLKCFDTIVLLV